MNNKFFLGIKNSDYGADTSRLLQDKLHHLETPSRRVFVVIHRHSYDSEPTVTAVGRPNSMPPSYAKLLASAIEETVGARNGLRMYDLDLQSWALRNLSTRAPVTK